jgi:hypothetical protein
MKPMLFTCIVLGPGKGKVPYLSDPTLTRPCLPLLRRLLDLERQILPTYLTIPYLTNPTIIADGSPARGGIEEA